MLMRQMFTHQASCQGCFKLDPPPCPMEHGQKCPPSFSNSSDTERVDVGGSLRLSLLLTDPSLFIEEIGAQDSTGQHFNLNFEEKKRTKEKKKSPEIASFTEK